MNLTRRQFAKLSLAAVGATALSGWGLSKGIGSIGSIPPITGQIIGASAALGHKLRTGGFPAPNRTLEHDIVIIGGGIAGLGAAYILNKAGVENFTLLELENHTGGNSSSGKNAVSAYPWGAHYVPLLTEESTAPRRLFEELGIITGYEKGLPVYNDFYLCAAPHERLYRLGRWQDGLVPNVGTTAEEQAQFKKFFVLMEGYKTAKGVDGRKAFAIPVDKSSTDTVFRALDTLTMTDWLHQHDLTAEPLHWYVNYCCRDDYGTLVSDTSAWAGIHYFAARTGRAANADPQDVVTWPEGNGWLVEKLRNPQKTQVQTNALVYSVRKTPSSVAVDYYDASTRETVRIEAKTAIMATPRFIAARLTDGLSAEGFSYSPWAVANITLKTLPKTGGAPLSWDNVSYNSPLLGYVVATHQIPQAHPLKTVLTYYWPLTHISPLEARKEALARSYQDWQDAFLQDLYTTHPDLKGQVEHLDVCLWGHAMARPIRGFIWGKERQEALRQEPPLFFAHSDMSGMSIFEEAYTHGVVAAEQAMTYLRHPYQSVL
jgi:hypothetical protein